MCNVPFCFDKGQGKEASLIEEKWVIWWRTPLLSLLLVKKVEWPVASSRCHNMNMNVSALVTITHSVPNPYEVKTAHDYLQRSPPILSRSRFIRSVLFSFFFPLYSCRFILFPFCSRFLRAVWFCRWNCMFRSLEPLDSCIFPRKTPRGSFLLVSNRLDRPLW